MKTRWLALFLLACGAPAAREPGPPHERATHELPETDAGVIRDGSAVTQPAATADGGASAAVKSCATMNATYNTAGIDACVDGTAPAASSDFRVSIDAAPREVRGGATVKLTLRIENVTSTALAFRAARLPVGAQLVVANERGRIAPPAGSPTILPNPTCAAVDCAPPSDEPRSVVPVSLAPHGVLEGTIEWKASRVAWPPPQRELCCGSMGTTPDVRGPLPLGSYRVTVSTVVVAGGKQLDLTATTTVDVK